MSDEDLRDLERAAARDPAARVRLARALLRLGRSDEAFLGLLACAREDEGARRALGEFPAWRRQPGGTAGNTACLDVAPLERAPALAWVARGRADPSRPQLEWRVVASPLAILHFPEPTAAAALDPATGEVLWTRPPLASPHAAIEISGHALVFEERGHVVSVDLVTGAELARWPLRRGFVLRGATEGLLLEATRDELLVHELPDPAREPRGTPRSFQAPGFAWRAGLGFLAPDAVLATRSHLAFQGGGKLQLLDRATGKVLWRLPAREARVDEQGAVVLLDGVTAYDLAGRALWSAPAQSLAAVTPSSVVILERGLQGRTELSSLDRRSGSPRMLLRLPPGQFGGEPAVARDVVYVVVGDEIVAVRATGEELWRFPLADVGRSPVYQLVPIVGGLVARCLDGTVFRLADRTTGCHAR